MEGVPAPVLFPNYIQHNVIAGKLTQLQGLKVLSAGFCNTKGDVWGSSVSLGVNSKEQDSIYIKKMLTD